MTTFRFFLDWEPNCQFAGLIWACEKGLFRRAGLNVALVPPSAHPNTTTLDLVLDGGLCAGCMEENLIVRAVAEGKAIKAIGATMQDSPMHLITLAGNSLRSLHDLPGRRIAMHGDGEHLLATVLALHGIDGTAVAVTVGGWSLDDLTDGRFDAVQGYTTTEPHTLARRGIATHLIPVRHHGLHPWAQMMFARQTTIDRDGGALAAFVGTAKTGWREAMGNPNETAAMIAALSAEHDDAAENRDILGAMMPLITGGEGLDRVVATDPERWRRNLATYARFGMIPQAPDYDAVVCETFM